MAMLITYLLYTNSTIAVLTTRWLEPSPERLKEDFLRARKDYSRVYKSPRWMLTLLSHGVINMGCCCCESSQQYIYSREDVMRILHSITVATSRLDGSARFPDDHHSQLKMTSEIADDVTEHMGMLHHRSVLFGDDYEDDEPVSARDFHFGPR